MTPADLTVLEGLEKKATGSIGAEAVFSRLALGEAMATAAPALFAALREAWRNIAERDAVLASQNRKMIDLLVDHAEHLVNTADERKRVEGLEDSDKMLELVRARELQCIAKWKSEDQKRFLKQPDYGELLDWLCERADVSERDAALLRRIEAENLEVRVDYEPDGERSWRIWRGPITRASADLRTALAQLPEVTT